MRSALEMLLAKSPRLEDATRTLIAPVRLHVSLPCQRSAAMPLSATMGSAGDVLASCGSFYV